MIRRPGLLSKYVGQDVPARRQFLEAVSGISDAYDQDHGQQTYFPVRHRFAYECREIIKYRGGRWDAGVRFWFMQTQDDLDKVLAACDIYAETGQLKFNDEPVIRTAALTFYTAVRSVPVQLETIVNQGTPAEPVFYRVVKINETPSRFADQTVRDLLTGLEITSGYMWSCVAVEVIGEERDKLLS